MRLILSNFRNVDLHSEILRTAQTLHNVEAKLLSSALQFAQNELTGEES